MLYINTLAGVSCNQAVGQPIRMGQGVSIPLRVCVATKKEYIEAIEDKFQYPRGCELQPVTFCHMGILRRFNTLAGVSCNCKFPISN